VSIRVRLILNVRGPVASPYTNAPRCFSRVGPARVTTTTPPPPLPYIKLLSPPRQIRHLMCRPTGRRTHDRFVATIQRSLRIPDSNIATAVPRTPQPAATDSSSAARSSFSFALSGPDVSATSRPPAARRSRAAAVSSSSCPVVCPPSGHPSLSTSTTNPYTGTWTC